MAAAIAAVSCAPAPPLIIMGQLYEFGKGASQSLGMDKSDSAAPAPRSGSPIDQVCAFGGEISQSLIKVVDGERNVMHSFPVFLQKPADGTTGRKRLKQLDERTAKGKQRFLHVLRNHRFAIQRADPVEAFIIGQGCVKVEDGQSDVIDVVEAHDPSVNGLSTMTPIRGGNR